MVFSFALLEKPSTDILARPLYTGNKNYNWDNFGMDSVTMLKGLNALEDLIKQQEQLRKDGLIFIFERGLWQEFLGYHTKKSILSSDQIPDKIFGYTLFELKKIIDFAKGKGWRNE